MTLAVRKRCGLIDSRVKRVARAALSAGATRFVFASSTSARAAALNNYGRVKRAIEEQLLALSIPAVGFSSHGSALCMAGRCGVNTA